MSAFRIDTNSHPYSLLSMFLPVALRLLYVYA